MRGFRKARVGGSNPFVGSHFQSQIDCLTGSLAAGVWPKSGSGAMPAPAMNTSNARRKSRGQPSSERSAGHAAPPKVQWGTLAAAARRVSARALASVVNLAQQRAVALVGDA